MIINYSISLLYLHFIEGSGGKREYIVKQFATAKLRESSDKMAKDLPRLGLVRSGQTP